MNRSVAIIFGLMLVASFASAGPDEEAVVAYLAKNYAQAMKLLRPLADQGEARAQFNLGAMYHKGLGVPQNYTEAAKWYRLAAEQGIVGAQANLGVMYANGQGVPQNDKEAVNWYRLAADQGDATGQSNLGVMYATGKGVPQNDVQAHLWFNLAASQGIPEAVTNRDIVAESMTPEQVAEAQRLAANWKPKLPKFKPE